MNQHAIKKVRKETRREFAKYIAEASKLSLPKRIGLALRIVFARG